jgi:hypothetical protein
MPDNDHIINAESDETVVRPDESATVCDLAWSDEIETEAAGSQVERPERRPMSYALTGLLLAVIVAAIGLVAFVIGTGQLHRGPPATSSPPTTAVAPAPAVVMPPASPPRAPVTVTAVPPAPVTVMAPPQVVPSTGLSRQDNDFLALTGTDAARFGKVVSDPATIISQGHAMCSRMAQADHPTDLQVTDEWVARYGEEWGFINAVLLDAKTVYCPQYN